MILASLQMILGLKNTDANYAEIGSFFIFDSHYVPYSRHILILESIVFVNASIIESR